MRLILALLSVLIVTAIFGWLYAPYGVGDKDGGWILSFSWRLLRGQIPYKDFVYILPPGSILLHALPLYVVPSPYQVMFGRLMFFFSVALYSLLSAVVLYQLFDLKRWRLRPDILALLFFVFSVQSHQPMPWYTVDGVLFSVIGLYFLSCRQAAWGAAVGALFLFLAAGCKQPFFFVVPFGLGYVWIMRGWRDVGIAVGTLTGLTLVVVGVAVGMGLHQEPLSQFAGQAGGVMSLIQQGVVPYVKTTSLALGPAVLAWVVLERGLYWIKGRRLDPAWFPYVALGTIMVAATIYMLVRQTARPPAFHYPSLFFLAVAVPLLYELKPGRRDLWTLAFMLSIAWCSSVSYGYTTPVTYGAPLIFGLLYYSHKYLRTRPAPLCYFLLCLSLAVQAAGYQFPTDDAPRAELKHDLGTVFPKLKYVRSTERNLQRYAELKRLHETYGDHFTVLPGIPLANYLTDTTSPVSLDYLYALHTTPGIADLAIRDLDERRPYVFLESKLYYRCPDGYAGCKCPDWLVGCSVPRHVAENWTLAETGRFFQVYRAPN